MNLDPNWFYSSLAQSAAAIVGLLASVLIVRIQMQLTASKESRREILVEYLQLRHEVRSTFPYLQQIIDYCRDTLPQVQEALQAGRPNVRVPAERTFGREGVGPEYVSVTPEYEQRLKQDHQAALILLDSYRPIVNATELAGLPVLEVRLERTIAAIPERAQRIPTNYADRIGRLVLRIERHRAEAAILYPAAIVVVLTWVSIFGLLLPLARLSAYQDGSKPWLIFAFAVGILALPAFMTMQIVELVRLRRITLNPEDVIAA